MKAKYIYSISKKNDQQLACSAIYISEELELIERQTNCRIKWMRVFILINKIDLY